MQKQIKQQWHFSQSPEEVWDYLTKPELLEQWFMKMDFKPVVGHKFSIAGKGGCSNHCEVTEVTPFTRLSYSWKYASDNDQQYYDSTVVWTLVPSAKGTELNLVHDGFAAIEDYNKHLHGWTMLVGQMVERLKVVAP